MNNGALNNPRFQLPPGLTEADMVDLVDGALAPDREAVVIAALKANPGLGLLVKQMRADRTELAELGTARFPGPVGMIEAIEAKLNRAALSELVAESEEFAAPIPISTVVPSRRSLVSILAESVWGRRLATAASLAIVGGVGYLAVREVSKSWPTLPPTAPVVAKPSPNNTTTPDVSGPGDTDVAVNTTSPNHGADDAAPSPDKIAVALGGGDVNSSAAPAAAPELTLTEALSLAESGRLVISVRSSNLEGSLRHLQELSRTSDHATRWCAFELNALPTELAAPSAPLPDDAPPADAIPRPGQPAATPTFASEHGTSERPPANGRGQDAIPVLTAPHLAVRALRVVQTDASARSLDDLLKNIAVNKNHKARFRALPEQAGVDVRPSVDAESVLWWTRGASSWTSAISIPVIVETVE